MLAVGDDRFLYLLEFEDCPDLDKKLKRLQTPIDKGSSQAIDSIKKELNLYFDGILTEFQTPFQMTGSLFQKRVWEELIKIPYGMTISYSSLALSLGNEKARRAVAKANGSNSFPILIPCHRVIHTDMRLGGYNSGVARKKWLIEHEAKRNLLV